MTTSVRVYFAVPGYGTIGSKYATFDEAREQAAAVYAATVERIKAGYPADWPGLDKIAHVTAATRCVVDVRYVGPDEHGGSTDGVIKRINVAPTT